MRFWASRQLRAMALLAPKEAQRPRHRKGECMCQWRQRLELCSCKPRNTKDGEPPPEAERKAWKRFSPIAFRDCMALLTS